MFYDKQQAINACSTDPSLIFNAIKHGYYDVVEILIDKNINIMPMLVKPNSSPGKRTIWKNLNILFQKTIDKTILYNV